MALLAAHPARLEHLHVVILERDSALVTALGNRIATVGWSGDVLDAAPGAEELLALRAHALVADLGLLGWEGLERVRVTAPGLAVLVTGVAGTPVSERVLALRSGADDWIAKPCHPEEVLARIEAVVRRQRAGAGRSSEEPLLAGELEVRPGLFQAYVRGRSLELTRRELELLVLLMGAEGRVLEREDIYARVWGYAMAHGDRSVDVFVRKLRRKLRAASPAWRYIHTHFGVGYRFAAESQDGGGTA